MNAKCASSERERSRALPQRWVTVSVSTVLLFGALSTGDAAATLAADLPGAGPTAIDAASLDKLQGQPVDIVPWAYAWRADRAVQEKPEACFIPRRLEAGERISVKNAPTYFETVAYEIDSQVNEGKILATVELPSRQPLQTVRLRFRHPQAAPIQRVTVNNQPWTHFNPDKEWIELKGLTGSVAVTAHY